MKRCLTLERKNYLKPTNAVRYITKQTSHYVYIIAMQHTQSDLFSQAKGLRIQNHISYSITKYIDVLFSISLITAIHDL